MTPEPIPPDAVISNFSDAQLAQIKKLIDAAHAQHHQERVSQGDVLLVGVIVFFAFVTGIIAKIAPDDGVMFSVFSQVMMGGSTILFANLRRANTSSTPTTPSTNVKVQQTNA